MTRKDITSHDFFYDFFIVLVSQSFRYRAIHRCRFNTFVCVGDSMKVIRLIPARILHQYLLEFSRHPEVSASESYEAFSIASAYAPVRMPQRLPERLKDKTRESS